MIHLRDQHNLLAETQNALEIVELSTHELSSQLDKAILPFYSLPSHRLIPKYIIMNLYLPPDSYH